MNNQIKLDTSLDLPLREVVFLRLRQAILQGEFKPEERLMEIRLANQMGVSRTPVRDAIRRLEIEGLVHMLPRRGAYVANITKQDMQDVLEVRGTLEELAVELCCKKVTDKVIKDLIKANEAFKKAIERNDILKIADADVLFHDVIYKATWNRRLIQMINNLREQMYRYRLEYIKNESARPILLKEHNELIECLKNKDVLGAKATIKNHIEKQEEDITRAIAENTIKCN